MDPLHRTWIQGKKGVSVIVCVCFCVYVCVCALQILSLYIVERKRCKKHPKMSQSNDSDWTSEDEREVEKSMRGFEYLWNGAVCLIPAQAGLSLELQYRDDLQLYRYCFLDTDTRKYWLRCPYCKHSFHRDCATNLRLGEIEYYGWACCREIDYTLFRGGPTEGALEYIEVIVFRIFFAMNPFYLFRSGHTTFFALLCRLLHSTTDIQDDHRTILDSLCVGRGLR